MAPGRREGIIGTRTVRVKSEQMITPKFALVLASALLGASAAHAQLAAYGTVSVRQMIDIPYTQGTISNTNGSFAAIGGTGGVYYDWRTFGPVRLGADVRGSISNSTKGAYNATAAGGHLSSILGGVRASFHVPLIPLKPYIQGSTGLARTNFGTDYNSSLATSGVSNTTGIQLSNHVEYDVFAGADLAILPLVDFRVVELGYGAVQGHSHTYPVESISSGIVIHFPFTGRK